MLTHSEYAQKKDRLHTENTVLCIKDAAKFEIITTRISETLNQWYMLFSQSVKYGMFMQIKQYVIWMTFSLPLDLDSPGTDL
jgi:hypothetical protein